MKRLRHHFSSLRNSVLFSWVLSYLVILLIPVAMSGVIYGSAIGSMRREVEKVYRGEFEQLQFLVEGRMEEMKRIALELSLNTDLLSLLSSTSAQGREHYLYYLLQQRLRDYSVTNSYIDTIAVGYLDLDVVVSARSLYTLREFSDIELGGRLTGLLERREHKNRFEIIETTGRDGKPSCSLVYLLSLPLESGSRNNALALIKLNDTLRQGLVETLGDKRLEIEIGGNILRTAPDPGEAGEDSEKRYTVLTARSDDGAVFRYHVPKDEFYVAISRIQLISLSCILACIVFCTAALAVSVRRNYNPVSRLLLKLGGVPRRLPQNYKNEFDYIERSLASTLDEMEQLEQERDRSIPALRDLTVSKLLRGDLPQEELAQLTQGGGAVNLRYPCFAVVGIAPVEYEELFGQWGDREKNFYLLQYIVRNMMEDFSSAQSGVYSVTLDNVFYTILGGDPAFLSEAVRRIHSYPELLHSLFGASVRIGISERSGDVAALCGCCGEAAQMLEYCEIFEKSVAAYRRETHESIESAKSMARLVEANRKFHNAVSAGDWGGARRMLGDLFDAALQPDQTLESIRMNLSAMMNLFRSSLSEFESSHPWIPAEAAGVMERMMQCGSAPSLLRQLEEELGRLEQLCVRHSEQESQQLRDAVLSYMEKNFAQYELNVSSIAGEFGMTAPALSKLFKKWMGVGPLDYLHQMKIRRAKELLLTREYTVAQVAALTGYNDASSFIRSFKKYEGISPGKLLKQ